MIQIIIIINVLLLLVSLVDEWPKPGLYIFKTACLMLLIPGLFFVLFFTLVGLDEQALNVELHPWSEYVSGRFLMALGVTIILLIRLRLPTLGTGVSRKIWSNIHISTDSDSLSATNEVHLGILAIKMLIYCL